MVLNAGKVYEANINERNIFLLYKLSNSVGFLNMVLLDLNLGVDSTMSPIRWRKPKPVR